jgi:ABC-type dipeptide/oligopeptide/nickel transport system permease component
MPVFWLGILLLMFFSLRFDIFPLIGAGDLDGVIAMLWSGEVFKYPGDFLAAVADVLHHLTLPALALGFTLAATVSRLSRSAMLEVISQDYIRTARAKGQLERAVVYKHALRNMMVPLLTIIGLFVAIALTGTVLTETVFTRPGLGKMLVDAIGARDYPLAQGAITVFTMTIIVVNLVVDMLYAVVDPRIAYK